MVSIRPAQSLVPEIDLPRENNRRRVCNIKYNLDMASNPLYRLTQHGFRPTVVTSLVDASLLVRLI